MNLKAGRELDLLVAHRVMGITILTKAQMEAEAKEVWKEQSNCRFFMTWFRAWPEPDGSATCIQQCRQYSTKIEEAWTLRDRLGRLMELNDYGPYGWRCCFLATQPGQQDVEARANTGELAICLAALLAVNQNSEEYSTTVRCTYCGAGERLNYCKACWISFCCSCANHHSQRHVQEKKS